MTRQEALTIVEKVIPHLEGEWAVEKSDSTWQINIVDGPRKIGFWRWPDGDTGHFEISGLYPHFNGYFTRKNKDIKVSVSKSPKKIAKDIMKRFMPGYEKDLAEIVERIDAHDAYYRRQEELLTPFLNLLGETPRLVDGKPNWETGNIDPHYDLISKISITSNEAINMNLSDIPIGIAEKIIKLLVDWYPPKPIFLRQLDRDTAEQRIREVADKKFKSFPPGSYELHRDGWNNHYLVENNATMYEVWENDDASIELITQYEKKLKYEAIKEEVDAEV
jgi:hypothetical protein